MGVEELYDALKSSYEAEHGQKLSDLRTSTEPATVADWICCSIMLIVIVVVTVFAIRAAINAYKILKRKAATEVADSNIQHISSTENPVNESQYSLTTVGIIKVKTVVQAANYREIACSFVNNDISLEFNLTDAGEYSWLNEGDEVKVNLAKDQFKYYVSRCAV